MHAGPFHYFFVCNSNESIKQPDDAQKIHGDGYFQVAPTPTVRNASVKPEQSVSSGLRQHSTAVGLHSVADVSR